MRFGVDHNILSVKLPSLLIVFSIKNLLTSSSSLQDLHLAIVANSQFTFRAETPDDRGGWEVNPDALEQEIIDRSVCTNNYCLVGGGLICFLPLFSF